ncbi:MULTISPECIES: hypothetical protein [Aerosakkonema]|uniref:hypothetical protein n=1 Tax=Aerosakkonema TaxID=1246629 RepID=UPI0035B863AC
MQTPNLPSLQTSPGRWPGICYCDVWRSRWMPADALNLVPTYPECPNPEDSTEVKI